jgi:molybdopterin molybdotransferase
LTDYAQALETVLEYAAPLGTEDCALGDLLGRVLAEPVCAELAMPFFDSSSVDGYAVTEEDVDAGPKGECLRLELAGTIRAGDDPTGIVLQPGRTLQILTGAALPQGAAAVVMQEDVHVEGGSVVIDAPVTGGQYIRRRGEEFDAGSEVAPAGIVVTPGVVAAIAAIGKANATVFRRPRVGLLVTGDELVAPGNPLRPGQIYESNSHGLTASLLAMRFEAPVVERVPDDAPQTRAALANLLRDCDVVLTSGGVSVGEYDHVKPALADLGVETILWGVAMKPGKPFYFGWKDGCAVLGLPGNPVAAMVTFHTLVRPYLLRSIGLSGRLALSRAGLASALTKEPGRLEFVPCRLTGGIADPVLKRGSHMPGTLVAANALAICPRGIASLAAGDEVEVMMLEGSVT